ncbi:MAG TPA: GNAT family N-acetyltransferase, partial [Euzebyales bacterium]|nr:GNAT family N-acetyltransferase [Euzebyales bacterium]
MELTINPQLTPHLRNQLIALWTTVANAGGAVGLVAPASTEDVAALAEPAFARVEAGKDDIVVAFDDGRPVGFGFLETNDIPLTAHWATIRRLQRAPSCTGRGIGVRILDALEDVARDRGLLRVALSTRGGTDRERLYLARGYQ